MKMNTNKSEGVRQALLSHIAHEAYTPQTVQQLATTLGVCDVPAYKTMVRALVSLEEEGVILRNKHDAYRLATPPPLHQTGKLTVHPKGFGFVVSAHYDADVYVHAKDFNGALHGDTVEVLLHPPSSGTLRPVGKVEGVVRRIVQRHQTKLIGTFTEIASAQGRPSFDSPSPFAEYACIIPDDKRVLYPIYVALHDRHGAIHGQKVLATIVGYPEGPQPSIIVRVREVLGHKDDVGIEALSIRKSFDLPEHFPPDVVAEAAQASQTVTEAQCIDRRDLRAIQTITIDGEDAKDLDDAVHVVPLASGLMRLGVHIADVGYYVPEGSAVDREAYARGTSTYLADRVIPMLPPALSNGICSLHPHVDRLTITCEMDIDDQGEVVAYALYPSLIRTVERMTYPDVRLLVESEDERADDAQYDPAKKEALAQRYAPLLSQLAWMKQLALQLRAKRMRRGAIDFNFPEAKITVDDKGNPVHIAKRMQTIAESIIEEFMLAANETVAKAVQSLACPFMYRIHERPSGEKFEQFLTLLQAYGYTLKFRGDVLSPQAFQHVLQQIKGTRAEAAISKIMLRSMKQARYAHEPLGHFGLATTYYAHFTSPIRRYPDLVVHRILRQAFFAPTQLEPHVWEALASRMGEIAEHCSQCERRAVDAEREIEALKKAQYMNQYVGETFEGKISSIAPFGFFVELDNTVEGLVRLSDMRDDYYELDERQMVLVGTRTGKTLRIGDIATVQVARVSIPERTIDFTWVQTGQTAAGHRPPKKKSKHKGKRRENQGTKNKNPKKDKRAKVLSPKKPKKKAIKTKPQKQQKSGKSPIKSKELSLT